MATRLILYNEALARAQQRRLSALTDTGEGRRLLDDVWDGGWVKYVLEQGSWNCAIRSVQMDYETGVTPDFGYARAFEKPSDWVRTAGVCEDQYFEVPLLRYNDEGGYFYADLDTIYVRFVSNDASYGGDLSKWPESLVQFAAAYGAQRINPRLTGTQADQQVLERETERLLRKALNKDGLGEATAFRPSGSWVNARRGNANRGDRGSRNTLLG